MRLTRASGGSSSALFSLDAHKTAVSLHNPALSADLPPSFTFAGEGCPFCSGAGAFAPHLAVMWFRQRGGVSPRHPKMPGNPPIDLPQEKLETIL